MAGLEPKIVSNDCVDFSLSDEMDGISFYKKTTEEKDSVTVKRTKWAHIKPGTEIVWNWASNFSLNSWQKIYNRPYPARPFHRCQPYDCQAISIGGGS